jgi:hypothetical protein
MTRRLTVAAAQLGPIQKAEGRDVVVARMVRLMEPPTSAAPRSWSSPSWR